VRVSWGQLRLSNEVFEKGTPPDPDIAIIASITACLETSPPVHSLCSAVEFATL
jgi:hypothetical protein